MTDQGLKSKMVILGVIVGVMVLVVVGEAVHPSHPLFYHPTLIHPAHAFLHHPPTTSVLHPVTYTGVEAVRVAATEEDLQLLCQNEGFHAHPTNCSRFYRCVDFVGTGLVFSLYMFECPKDHVFVMEIASCIPGTACHPSSIPVEQPSIPEQPPTVPDPPPSIPEQPSTVPDPPPSIPEQPPTVPDPPPSIPDQPPSVTEPPKVPDSPPSIPEQPPSGTEPPKVPKPPPSVTEESPSGTELPPSGTEPPSVPGPPPSVPEQPTTAPSTEQPPSVPPTGEECTTIYYYQHQDYCNVYYLCSNATVRYVCTHGTVFDQSRQMCRISAVDEGLCMGKAILPPTLLRTELIDGHLQLPAELQLPALTRAALVQPFPSPIQQPLLPPRPIAVLHPIPNPHHSPIQQQQQQQQQHQQQQRGNHFPHFQPLTTHDHYTRPLTLHRVPFSSAVGSSLVRTKVGGAGTGGSFSSADRVGTPLSHFHFPSLFPYQFPLAADPQHNKPFLHYTPFNNYN